MLIRDATRADAPALLDIYRPVVEDTATSFEIVPPTVAEFSQRIETASATHAWLVAEDGLQPLGYAYATAHRARAAYRYSTETSVYVAGQARRLGIGRRLYERLLEVLAQREYYHAFAGITLPNPASVALHEALGFEPIGVFPAVGFKFGKWHDVAWWSRRIREGEPREWP